MISTETPGQAPEWHPFSWTSDGHTPKIDIRTPAMIKAGFTAAEAVEMR